MGQFRFGRFEPVRITEEEWQLLDMIRRGLSRAEMARQSGMVEHLLRFRLDNLGSKLRLLAQM